MKEEIIIAGFGGQGVLSMGKILARIGQNPKTLSAAYPFSRQSCRT